MRRRQASFALADGSRGRGLQGLTDRLATTMNGRLTVHSPVTLAKQLVCKGPPSRTSSAQFRAEWVPMTDPAARREHIRRVVADVMRLPYVWPSPPDAASAATNGCGSCASKHALLAERLATLGVSSRPIFMIGPLVPPLLASDPEIQAGLGLVEVHECLTVSVPGTGPVRVDVTWDPPLIDRGLPGTAQWDGVSDMDVAVGPGPLVWAPNASRLREEKEALRARLYSGDDRAVRDRVLAAMSDTFARWRAAADSSGH